jgi:arylsulfatase
VPNKYYQLYQDIDPSAGFENDNRPFPTMAEKDKEDARKVYAMVTNIDENVGKLFQKLDELQLTENTLVLFSTDNGPQQTRYVGGMRGRKGSVYRGGVRVPLYMKYPAQFEGNKDIETTAAHIDILPTLADICHAPLPNDRIIDGKSLLPLIRDKQVDWTDRPLFFYWTRRYPELYNNMALQKGKYKLVAHADYDASIENFELFNIEKDPYEQHNLVPKEKNLAGQLKTELDQLYNELILSPHLIHPPLIVIGSEQENPIILNRNDADGERGIWAQEDIYGKWLVSIREGRYNIQIKFIKPVEPNGKMYFETGPVINQIRNDKHTDLIEMKNVFLPKMDGDLIPFYSVGSKNIFPFWVELEKVGE